MLGSPSLMGGEDSALLFNFPKPLLAGMAPYTSLRVLGFPAGQVLLRHLVFSSACPQDQSRKKSSMALYQSSPSSSDF